MNALRQPDAALPLDTEPNVTIEMGGSNLVIRSCGRIDQASTSALVTAVNAADEADTVVIIDPDPIRCDDQFASGAHADVVDLSLGRPACRPVAVTVAASGVIRIGTESGAWLVDIVRGRLCRTGAHLDPRFLAPEAWTPVIAVCVTPTRLIALGIDGNRFSATRARGPVALPA